MAAHGQSELINAALEIMEERDAMLSRIRDLLESGKDQEAITLMKRYCGITNDKKSDRANSRLN
jgi:hypothetical protein